MTSTTPSHQLIVVGNGFDLACSLKSLYADFFGDRINKAKDVDARTEAEWKRIVDDEKLTAWDFMLAFEEGPDWCNIEKAIGGWVLQQKDKTAGKPLVERLLDSLKRLPFSDDAMNMTGDYASAKTDRAEWSLLNTSRYIWHKAGEEAQGMDKSQLLGFLRLELGIVEDLFKAYLDGAANSNSDYCGNANTLMTQLITGQRLGGISGTKDVSVISFNYTRPFRAPGYVLTEDDIINIHGNVDGEIIFGIDGKECMEDLDALPFTKTYRIASMGVGMPRQLYVTAIGVDGEHRTSSIKFFGHSLGEADYSYFQAIFDGVDLYGGSTKLIFYYRPWPGKNEEELRSKMVMDVSKLLTTYGKTLDNKDHGKNLMHKLLLEGRLEVRCI
ncbi:MAG: hypothetical protein IKG18_01860 [Atopobiaceae bacterium]|nr:hypothetical protein [Atopobiaceae bacterium]